MPALTDTVRSAMLLAALRTYPTLVIDVPTYALLTSRSLPRAYADVREGRVETRKDGRKVSVLVAPLLESMGFPLTPPSGLNGEPLNEAAVHAAYAPAIGEPGIDYALAGH